MLTVIKSTSETPWSSVCIRAAQAQLAHTKKELRDPKVGNKLLEYSGVETCVGCTYNRTCERTDPRNMGKEFHVILCQLEVDQI